MNDVSQKTAAYQRKSDYQYDMYMSLKTANSVLVFFYLFLFTLIHVLFLEQYIRGVERSEFWDSVWLTVFFLYPYFIYLVEQGIYFVITYILSYIYGKTYVYEFDKLLMNTDFYYNPDTNMTPYAGNESTPPADDKVTTASSSVKPVNTPRMSEEEFNRRITQLKSEIVALTMEYMEEQKSINPDTKKLADMKTEIKSKLIQILELGKQNPEQISILLSKVEEIINRESV